MKLLLILALIITSATIAKAQGIKKGDILLGATFGIYSSSNNNDNGNGNGSSSNTNLSPRIGVGIGNNSILGARTSFGYGRTKSGEINKTISTNTGVGVSIFWQKLFPIKGQIGWYVEPNAGFYFSKIKNTNNTDKYIGKNTEFNVNVVPGLYYQPIPKLFISVDFGGLGYSHYKRRTEENTASQGISNSTSKGSTVGLTLLNSFIFGVDFVLGKKA